MAETIIGRHQEKTLLEKYYNSGKAEFIAMYGRRRIGKTFLIRQYFKNQFSFDMTGVLEGNKNEQITAFHMALKTYGYTGKKNTTWLDSFFALRQLLEPKLQDDKRCVIFIDELPCLDTPKAGFVHALGHFGIVGQTGNPKLCSSSAAQPHHGWFAISSIIMEAYTTGLLMRCLSIHSL